MNARFCDLDHVRPWPAGPTAADNLICLCRRHHRIKQTARWTVTLSPDGIVTWRDPAGGIRSTSPVDHLGIHADARPALSKVAAGGHIESPRAASPLLVDGSDGEWSLLHDVLEHAIAEAERRVAALGQRCGGRARSTQLAMSRHAQRGGRVVDVQRPRAEVLVTGCAAAPRRSISIDDDPPPF